MPKTAIIFGSSVGNTRFVAEKVHAAFPDADLIAAETAKIDQLKNYDFFIMGTSTWGVGQIQDDFETFVEKFLTLDLSNKTIALFGLGDQQTYPDTFCDGMGKLYELLEEKNPAFIGQWPGDDYDFSESKAFRDEMFVGLPLDEDNEPDLTDGRIAIWSEDLKDALGIQ
ncbi:flavodoxin [Marinilabilia sp.]|uniref:flavodoxin n=1 Tax=Marinilabilia sp. TaxID=2021252 RepID=UPI0025C4A7F3|nr:flavodoxin [Marinilabilia sp.]